MRPLLALVVVLTILGGLQGYLASRALPLQWSAFEEQEASGLFEIELTLTFDAGPDPFSFDTTDALSLEIKFRGESVMKKTDVVSAGTTIRESVSGMVSGENEFFVQVIPTDLSEQLVRAIRVRILRDGKSIAEKSLWSEPGEPVGGTVLLDMGAKDLDQEHDHATN